MAVRQWGLTVLALAVSSAAGALEFRTAQDIRYVTGGVGQPEVAEIEALGKDLSLRVLVAQGQDFLSGAAIAITNAKGQPVFSAVTDGPLIYVDLPQGQYTVAASGFGQHFIQHVSIEAGAQQRLVFRWPNP